MTDQFLCNGTRRQDDLLSSAANIRVLLGIICKEYKGMEESAFGLKKHKK
jgi:hypothetical protein